MPSSADRRPNSNPFRMPTRRPFVKASADQKSTGNNKQTKLASASALHSNNKSVNKSCLCCGNVRHVISTCIKFLQMTLKQKYDYLNSNKICLKCLKPVHNFDTCDFTCKLCKGGHHSLDNPSTGSMLCWCVVGMA